MKKYDDSALIRAIKVERAKATFWALWPLISCALLIALWITVIYAAVNAF